MYSIRLQSKGKLAVKLTDPITVNKINDWITNEEMPTAERLCYQLLNCSLSSYLNAVKNPDSNYYDFKKAYEYLQMKQRDALIMKSLTSKFNPVACIFLLKTMHGFIETSRQDINVKQISVEIKDYKPNKGKNKGVAIDNMSSKI